MATLIAAKDVAALRARTGAGLMDCKKVLQETGGDIEQAIDVLRKKGIAQAEKRAGRGASEGLIGSYVHFNGKVGVLVELNCETDFVARTDDFKELARDIALHVASANPIAVTAADVPADVVRRERAIYEGQVAESGKPENVRAKIVEGKLKKFFSERALMEQPFVKDDKQTVGDLVKAASGKLGENIVVRRFARLEIGTD
ncbi:MAG TPA: translation elongation factor Ts [Gemmatimonadales bacterium]